jgi:hypothetical protein
MRLRFLAVLLAICAVLPVAYAKDKPFQQGRLLNVTADEQMVEGTTYRRAVFIVQVNDLIYTLQGDKIKPKAKDYAAGLIIGDPVQVRIDGNKVYLQTGKDKTIKLEVLKRERAAAPVAPVQAPGATPQ